jgi:hypothetical protein
MQNNTIRSRQEHRLELLNARQQILADLDRLKYERDRLFGLLERVDFLLIDIDVRRWEQ